MRQGATVGQSGRIGGEGGRDNRKKGREGAVEDR